MFQTEINFMTEQFLELSQFPRFLFQSLHLNEITGKDLIKLSVLNCHIVESFSHVFEVILKLEQRFDVEFSVLHFLLEKELLEVASCLVDKILNFESLLPVESVLFDFDELIVSFHGFIFQFN